MEKYRLSDLVKIKNGKDYKALNEGIYPVYGSGGLMLHVDRFLYDKPSVLLPRKGTLSNIQYYEEPFWTVDTIYYTEVNEDKVNPYYLYRYLRSLDLSGFDSGASIPSMTSKTYYGIKVELPNRLIQDKVAELLKEYDHLIDNNIKRIKLLEQMAENLYKEWFVRFRFPGYENAEFENGLPKGWNVVHMSEFCYVTDGTHDSPKEADMGVPLVTGKSIIDGFIDFKQTYNISETDHLKIKKRSGLKDGDILFSNIGTVGNSCIVKYAREFSVKNVIIFKPDSMEKTVFLYYWMNSETMQSIFSVQTNGASQQFVGLTFMRKYKILVPTEEIIKKFASYVLPIIRQMDLIHEMNENLIKQRDLLLPRLMSGRLEVK